MGLAQALATAVSGLRVAQSGLGIVAGNVANAETPGYVRRTVVQSAAGAGDLTIGVRVDGINRVLDQYLQAQYRTENAGGAYADLKSNMYQNLQGVYGAPGASNGIQSVYDAFTSALQALSTSPDDYSARANVISSAQTLAQNLNSTSSAIQGLRSQAELGLADSVSQANQAMQQIAAINHQLATTTGSDAAAATMLDQRDNYIDKLSQLMDIRVVPGDHNQISVFTTSGVQLVGTQASSLSFSPQGAMSANTQWSADPAKRSVGTVTLTSPSGATLDLVADKSIRSGQIAGYLEMRDQILVQAQGQLDQIASALSSSLSDQSIDGTAVTAGAQSGFDINVGGLSDGNSVSLAYTDSAGTVHHVTLVQVSDPSALPLPTSATADPNDKVIGVDLSHGVAAALTQLNSQFNGKIQFSNPSGTTLRILDDGAANTTTITDVTAKQTQTSLSGGSPEMPFFVDGSTPYTGAITGQGSESVGLAGRIAVNSGLLADPSKLVAYQAGVGSGDSTRPNFLYDQLTNASQTYSPGAGIGSVATPFSSSIPTYIQQMLSVQGAAADSASQLQQGQDVVVSALTQRMSDQSGVNIDEEMTQLLQLQNTYAANAHVLSAVKTMMDTLMNM